MLTGLVVGKFCPLHLGHERLIRFAQARCDRLVILSYTKPEFPGLPVGLRARWLETLYPDALRLVIDDAALATFATRTGTAPRILPHNDAPDDDHRHFCGWVCQAMLGLRIDRIFTSEAYGDGFAAVLAADYHAESGTPHPVEHIDFDQARIATPVSGSALRDDPGLRTAWLSDVVRDSLVARVALIGGESSGKTVLAQALAARFGTACVPEYGRELWELRDGALTFDDMLAIATKQIAREDAALDGADRWLFCDTTPLVTAFYSEAMFGAVDPALVALSRRRYDHLFLCEPDFHFVQDGTRRDAAFRQRQHGWYLERLRATDTPFTRLTGPIERRCERVADALSARSNP